MMNKIRTAVPVLMIAGASMMFVSANAYATNDDPHHEQHDGCDHGSNGKDCREDPSEKGKDCDEHGKHGGVNEDHCATTTTQPDVIVPLPDITVPTVPDVTVTTVPNVPVPALPVPDVTVPTVPGAPLSSGDEHLPATGSSSGALAGFATGMLLFGTGLRKLVRRPSAFLEAQSSGR